MAAARLSSLAARVTARAAPVALVRPASLAFASLRPATRAVHTEAKLTELGIQLPSRPKAAANYITCNRSGNLIFTAGHLPQKSNGELIVGKVGKDLTTEAAYDAARLVTINLLGTLKAELGDLDRVKKIVKVLGFVNCVDGYAAQPKVMNGASDLLVQVFEKRGIHSRSAVGTNALPLNVPVEIELIVEVEDAKP